MAETSAAETYTTPEILELGTLHDLTQRDKDFGEPMDGDFVFSNSLTGS